MHAEVYADYGVLTLLFCVRGQQLYAPAALPPRATVDRVIYSGNFPILVAVKS
jgi:hypothetical protein